MRLGVLTSGGDCPGLNAVIRAVVRKGERDHGDEVPPPGVAEVGPAASRGGRRSTVVDLSADVVMAVEGNRHHQLALLALDPEAQPTTVRRHLVNDRGMPKRDISFFGYWRLGRSAPG